MLAITSSDITIFGIIGLIIIAFVIIGLLKGFVRMTCGLISLSAGIFVGVLGFQNGASWAGVLIENPDPWMSTAVGIILGLATFFILRALFGTLLTPVKPKEGKGRKLAPTGGVLGFIMGAAFAWFCLSGIRYVGTTYELDWIRDAISNKDWLNATTAEARSSKQPPQPAFSKLKRHLDTSTPGNWHESIDILNSRARANLSKLTILVDNERAWTRANLEKDIREAAKQAQINYLLSEQKAKLKALHGEQLLHSDFIKDACKDKETESRYKNLDVEKAIGLVTSQEKGE